jgi:hypothetical protein
MKKEYEYIMKLYSNKIIYEKSLPLKPTKKCSDSQIEEVKKSIKNVLYPSFDVLSELIDAGIVELESVSKNDNLSTENLDKNKLLTDLTNDGWDNLYTYKYIKYNLTLNFIMQIYLCFEQELIHYLKDKINYSFNGLTLFSALEILEKDFKIDSELKEEINKYRNVINVYKHGKGVSYNELIKNYKNVINRDLSLTNNDLTFIFNLNNISFNALYNTLIKLLECLS